MSFLRDVWYTLKGVFRCCVRTMDEMDNTQQQPPVQREESPASITIVDNDNMQRFTYNHSVRIIVQGDVIISGDYNNHLIAPQPITQPNSPIPIDEHRRSISVTSLSDSELMGLDCHAAS